MNACAELFTTLLNERNLSFQCGVDEDGDSMVEFPYQGKSYKMFFSGNDGCYLSLYQIFEHIPDEKIADVIFACNELNSQYKWITFYVNQQNDVILHDDAILSVENAAEETFELLVRMIDIANNVKPIIMKAIYA